MTRITTFKATNPIIWALVALSVAGGFFYANHSTIAARVACERSWRGVRRRSAMASMVAAPNRIALLAFPTR